MDRDAWTPTEDFENEVVGIVCDSAVAKTAHAGIVKLIQSGPPDAVYVIRFRDKFAAEACVEAGVDPVVADLNPWWESSVVRPIEGPLNMIQQGPYARPVLERRKTLRDVAYDHRRSTRRFEMLYGCTRVWVFRKASSGAMDEWNPTYSPRAKVIEFKFGKEKAPSSRGRRGAGKDPHA